MKGQHGARFNVATMIIAHHPTTIGRRTRAEHDAPRVLLATDDSDTARAAEEWIGRLCWTRAPAVDVLTVAPSRPLASRLWLQTYRTAVRDALLMSRETELLAAQRIANSVGSRLQREGTVVRVWARQGSVSDEILTFSRLERPDVVVIGQQGKSPHVLAWGSSIPQRVAEHTDVPVLIAHRPPDEGDGLPRSTLVVVPGEPAGEEAVRWLRWAGWLRKTELTLGWRGGPGGSSGDRLRKLASEAGVAALKEVVLEPQDPGFAIEHVDPGTFDLVALPRPIGSRANDEVRIATETRVAVLILPHGSIGSILAADSE